MTAARAITCPSCGGSIEIKAAGYTVNVGCQYCGSVLDVANPDVRLISEFQMAMRKLELPLGSRGALGGIEWEVIGYLERSDDESNWHEYLLFNPYGGYRWLIRGEGYWSLGTALPEQPANAFGDAVSWRGQRFSLDYAGAPTRTDYVLGEFYWRVQTGDTVQASLYEGSETTALSCEKSADETNWTYTEDLPGGAIEQAFRSADGSPLQFTGGPAQTPSPAAPRQLYSQTAGQATQRPPGEWGKLFKLAFGTLAACLVIMFVFGMGSTVAKQQIEVALDGPAKTFTIGTVKATRAWQPITVTAKSVEQFDNKWIDLDYTLVNQATQEAIPGYGVVERYSGTDSDGSWSEGSYTGKAKFAGVPSGVYDFQVEASMHSWATSTSSANYNTWNSGGRTYKIDIEAATGGVFWGNLVVIALLLLGPVIFLFFRSLSSGGRWTSGDSDDDDD